jgi:glycosyltransferase involved in cell wall biosynthesis
LRAWPELRFLEVGDLYLFRSSFPEQTEMVYTGIRDNRRHHVRSSLLTPWKLLSVARDLRRRRYDLIVVHPPLYAAWHPRSFLTVLKRRPFTFSAAFSANLAFHFLRAVRHTPIVVTDFADSFGIGAHNFFLFDRCRVFFKRELPADNWQVFYRTGHRGLPTATFRRKPRFRQFMDKLRPIGLGIDTPLAERAARISRPKNADIFFAGQVQNSSTPRERGLRELLSLRERGVVVDVPSAPVSESEFLERCASAWLVWSPSGFGWECFRHYEAAACGSVPVINQPTIERYCPLKEGRHCFLYPVEQGGLAGTVLAALRDKARLREMAAAARQHVLEHHTYAALCRYIAGAALAPEADGRSPAQ